MAQKLIADERIKYSNEELIIVIQDWVKKLCETGGREWCLRVPVDFQRDPDVLIIEICARFQVLEAKNSELLERKSELISINQKEAAWISKLQIQNKKLKNALFKFIPVTFHGEKKAFEDPEFTDAFKEMVIQAYLMTSHK